MQNRKVLLHSGASILACSILILDLLMTPFPAVSILYALPIYLLWRTMRGKSVYWPTAIATALGVIGLIAASPRTTLPYDVAGLLAAIGGLWIFAALLHKVTSWQNRIAHLESFLQEGLGASGEAVIILDHLGKIEGFNAAAENLFGYRKDEILGQPMHILMPHEHQATHDQMLLNRTAIPISQGLKHRYRERDIIHRDGHTIPTAITTGVYEANGIRKYMGLIIDLSKYREVERYHSKVAEEAHQSNTKKSTFLASMSHELRTPLNGIIGLLGLIHDEGLTPKESEYLSLALESATSLLDIINDVLDLSKLEAGELAINAEPFDINATIVNVCKLLRTRSDKKGINLIFNPVPSNNLWINGDCSIFRQIVINLVNNGIKYTDKGSVEIFVENRYLDNQTTELKFTVTDTGIGISPQDQLKLFKRFSRAGAAHGRQLESTGLGLAISKQMVELVGGTIGCDSDVDVGSSFWFTFPAKTVSGGRNTPEVPRGEINLSA